MEKIGLRPRRRSGETKNHDLHWDAAATCYSFNLNIALAAELISYLAYLAKCR
jgi:hypothetical protein